MYNKINNSFYLEHRQHPNMIAKETEQSYVYTCKIKKKIDY